MGIVVASLYIGQIRAIRPVVLAIEETGLDCRLPVSLSDSLEEQAETCTGPLEVKVETILITRSNVTDSHKVTGVFNGILSIIDVAVTVDIDELKVTCVCTEVGSVLMECIGCPVVGFLIVTEDTVGTESPDFSEFLAGIVVIEDRGCSLILGYPGTAVPNASLDAILEILSCELELVSP